MGFSGFQRLSVLSRGCFLGAIFENLKLLDTLHEVSYRASRILLVHSKFRQQDWNAAFPKWLEIQFCSNSGLSYIWTADCCDLDEELRAAALSWSLYSGSLVHGALVQQCGLRGLVFASPGQQRDVQISSPHSKLELTLSGEPRTSCPRQPSKWV